jgi:uncharacterized protein (TIGR02145 family)
LGANIFHFSTKSKMKNLKKTISFLIFSFVLNFTNQAQVGISANAATPDPKAILDINSTDKGLLIPRMTTADRTAITPTPLGLTVFDSSTKSYWYYNGSLWQELNTSKPSFPAVSICCNTWMAKNLDVTTYRNGDPIPQITDDTEWANATAGAWCYYNNDPANGPIYGKLYNGYAITDLRGLAPEGWHIATDHEWESLRSCLGGDETAALQIKAQNNNVGSFYTNATNTTMFSATPSGIRPGFFVLGGVNGSALYFTNNYMTHKIIGSGGTIDTNYYNTSLTGGLAVRCVKD